MKKVLATAAGVASVLVLAGCWPSTNTGDCVSRTDPAVFVDSVFVEIGNDSIVWCFDDGDGYPTVYPPITTAPPYPTN